MFCWREELCFGAQEAEKDWAGANFGVFSAAFAAIRQNHPVAVRMTAERARSLLPEPLRDGIDKRIVWRPTKAGRKKHPALPPAACINGRLIVSRIQPSDGSDSFLLCLFTTLEQDVAEILKIYGLRWNVETGIGSLKGAPRLDQLTSKNQTAQQAGVAPRCFSFNRVKRILNVYGPKIAAATTVEESKRLFALMNHAIGQAKLYPRKKRRPAYAREVWHSTKPFPRRAKA